MAVDESLSRDTDALVLPGPAHYATKIPIAHYQLRHFISCPEPDLIYYASGFDVYCLNTATRTQAIVTTLPWEARCTAAAHGFVCVGGADDGNFAAIRVAGFPPAAPTDVDAALPLDLEQRLPRPPLLAVAHRVRLDKIGEDIVNSISIHRMPIDDQGVEEVIAVLTNNDKTVRIYSLTQNLELTVLDLPFALNHATISPDGQLLVVVGDQPIAFFFQRIKSSRSTKPNPTESEVQSSSPQWQLLEEVNLYRPTSSSVDGYFTTAWSPHGRLCAVGSECGYIVVFDIDLLKRVEYGEDAIVQLVSSTRPDTVPSAGAVRTMYFSPAPWDLLVWSEDQGRVCVADLRANLKVKQVLHLDSEQDGIEKVEIADLHLKLGAEMPEVHREADFIRRYRREMHLGDTLTATNITNEYFGLNSERQRLHRRLGVVESDNDPLGLTAHERQVVDALRTTRQSEADTMPSITPQSINYDISTHSEGASLGSDPVVAATRRGGRQPQDRVAPRRRASIVVSIDQRTANVPLGAHVTITDVSQSQSPRSVPAHARRVTNEIATSTDDAWRTIEEALVQQARVTTAYTRTIETGSSSETANTTQPEFHSELRRLRQLTQARERLRNARASPAYTETYEFGLGVRRPSRATHDPGQGVRTAGLAMSQDGRTLYCGTEEGIFEFKMNLHARKTFPAITPR